MAQPVRVGRLFQRKEGDQSTTLLLRPPIGSHTNQASYMFFPGSVAHCDIPPVADQSAPHTHRDVGATGTYCEFKVQFTVRIHGMGMGSVTVATTLMVSYHGYN